MECDNMDNFNNENNNVNNTPESESQSYSRFEKPVPEYNKTEVITKPVTDYNQSRNDRGKSRAFSYISVALISSMIGGLLFSAIALYAIPSTSIFKDTALYKSLASNTATTTSTQSTNALIPTSTSTLATPSGALTVAQIAKKVGPAVVAVSTEVTTNQSNIFMLPGQNNQSSQNSQSGQSSQEVGMGTGIIFNSDGYIVTNYHVISGGQTIKVILQDNKEVGATIVNYDANLDLAVIKMNDKSDIPGIAELGDSSTLQVGDPVVAIGNPMGKELIGSVTSGIVSALNRQISVDNKTLSYIQTDAAINSGNSGGPLINSQGQVIGINTAKYGGSGVEGLGFAIPINVVKTNVGSLVKQLLRLGVSAMDITKDISAQYNEPIGVLVSTVETGSVAEKAGIKINDVIVKFDGQTVTTVAELNTIKAKHKAGDSVRVDLIRNGSPLAVQVKF
jgi:serine protease Do